MRRTGCPRAAGFLFRIAAALVLASLAFVSPRGILFPASFLLLSVLRRAEGRTAFREEHLRVCRLE